MINIDCYNNISCKLNDRLIIDFTLSKRDYLTEKDKVTLKIVFNNEETNYNFIPTNGVVKMVLMATTIGAGTYEIMVTKEDNRQETTTTGKITVY